MKKVFFIMTMFTVPLCSSAICQRMVHLVPICASTNEIGVVIERHKVPAKQKLQIFCEGDEVFALNAPVGGQISFYDAQGNLLVQDVFHASEYAIEIPALAVSIEISYGDVTLRGDLEENN